ncbi:MAG TPA: D-Ala-D-Ala carboxypeptidase family metallohydrolase [Microvirga sp.]|nr:D-Ala-D-Ala carboxypeptidase family metallohydrolase [Microvirga sp.]
MPPAKAQTAPAASAKAPTECLPAEFKSLIRELESRFGRVTLVSTTTLNTNNHGTGSTRHKLHTDCRAVDFKVAGDQSAVVAFLRERPEVLGINTFRNNGVIHIDYNERRRTAVRN